MTPISHAILPLVLSRRWIPRHNDIPAWRVSGVVAFSGVLPDLLSPHIGLAARHAAFSHSLAACALFTLFLGTLLLHPRIRPHRTTALLCAGAYAVHLVCDLITGGVPLLVPFYPKIWGDTYLPFRAWFILDGLLLTYVYLVYRWLPLRRRLVRSSPPPSSSPE